MMHWKPLNFSFSSLPCTRSSPTLPFSPSWVPPQVAKTMPLEVHIVPAYLLWSFLCLTFLSFVAGIFPARKMARHNIVEVLGHV